MSMMMPEGFHVMPDGTPMQGPPMGGPPMGQAPVEEQPPDFGASVREIIEQVRALADVGGTTEQERLIVEQVTTLIQKLAAGREKEDQALIGGGPATNALARAYGS